MSGQGSDDDDLASTRPSLSLPRIPGVVLQHEIARGGMGVVYRGRQDYIDRDVAVKLLSAELTDRAFVARFRREAKILAGIDHPNIVRCHFAGQTDDGNSYLVMEFIAGASLKRHIAEHGAMPVATALRVLLALVQALDHAHQLGVIHRDVKPENILLAETKATPVDVGFPYVPKIVDLGLARASEGTGSFGVTSPGSVMGTPATMSPEQFDEPDAVDFRSDVYGLGCVLHEMLAGRPAFEAKKLTVLFAQKRSPTPPDPCAANTAIPAAVGALAQWMLATDRAARPASYAALAARIRELLDDPEVAAGGDREATRISRRPLPAVAARAPRRGGRLALASAAVVAAAAGVWLALGSGGGAGDDAGAVDAPPAPAIATGPAAPAPTNVRVDGPLTVDLGGEVELTARAEAAAGAALRYAWTIPAAFAVPRGPIDAATLRLEVRNGLPGIEVPVEVAVRAGDSKAVVGAHAVRIADAPPGQALRGATQLGAAWLRDRLDAAWVEVPDDIAGLSCMAGTERRTLHRALGDDAYWEWSGALESAEAEGTPFAVVAVRFRWATSALQVECRRQGPEGLSWTMAATAIDFADGEAARRAFESRLQQVRERVAPVDPGPETRRALAPPLLQAYQQPPLMSDDAKADWEPRGWFTVRRVGGELQAQVGVDNKRPDGELVAESRSEWAKLPAPAGPCWVELVVDKGIGRFFLTSR